MSRTTGTWIDIRLDQASDTLVLEVEDFGLPIPEDELKSGLIFEFGYRSGLYTRLNGADYSFQFVGSSAEPFNNKFGDPTRDGTVRPTLDLRKLGQDGHHGYGGISRTTLRGVPERDFKPRLFCCRSRRHQQTEKQCGH